MNTLLKALAIAAMVTALQAVVVLSGDPAAAQSNSPSIPDIMKDPGQSVVFCRCDDGACEKTCYNKKIKNSASVVVTSVKIKQLDFNGCNVLEKKHSANVTAGKHFHAHLLKSCAYKISFKTTKGCTGDKTVTVDSKDINTTFKLKGACGTLKTAKSAN